MISKPDTISEDETGIRLEFLPESDIAFACGYAEGIARHRGLPVSFTFNGVEVTVKDGTDAEPALLRWDAEMDRRAKEWQESPEGKSAALAQENRRIDDQRQINQLMQRSPMKGCPLGSVIRWCAALAKYSQRIDVVWDKEAAIDALKACGYKQNAHVGRPKEDFEDATLMGEYIIGQVLDCMIKGMPPHEMTIVFAERGGFL